MMSKRGAFKLVVPGLMWWSLVFIGWGLDDLTGYFSNPARVGVIVVGVIATIYALVAIPDFDPLRKGRRPTGRQGYLMFVAGVALASMGWFLPFADRRSILVFADADLQRYAGVALAAVGEAIRWAGLRALGKQFSGYLTLQENHRLIETGIYGVVRHPWYLGAALIFIGWALVFRSWLVIPLIVLGGLLLSIRIRQEEKILAEGFGAEFEAYCRRTWRLLRYLY